MSSVHQEDSERRVVEEMRPQHTKQAGGFSCSWTSRQQQRRSRLHANQALIVLR